MGRRNTENNDRRTEQFRKLFIGGLTPQTDEIRLRKYYEQWGELVDFVVMKDNKTGRSRGFGFVTYRDPEMVDEAQNNRPHEVDGKIVEAKRAMPREDSNTPESHMTVNKLFVGGLKKDVTTEQLKHYFNNYGTITDCEIVTWKDSGESRGFGFVTFDDYDPVDKAILYKPHQIGSSRVDVKKALSKDEMEEIKRKQQNEPSPISCSTSSEYYQNIPKSTSTIPTFQNHIPHNTFTPNNMSCVGGVVFDGSFQAGGYQYPNISGKIDLVYISRCFTNFIFYIVLDFSFELDSKSPSELKLHVLEINFRFESVRRLFGCEFQQYHKYYAVFIR